MVMFEMAEQLGPRAFLGFDLDRAVPDLESVMQQRIDAADQFRAAKIIGFIHTNVTGESDLV